MSTSSSSTKQGVGARHPAPGRRPIKVTPRRKAEVDPHMIALVYFLIASRIVREANEAEAAASDQATNRNKTDAQSVESPS